MTEPIRQLLSVFMQSQDAADFQPLYDKTKTLVWTLCCRVLGNEQDARDAFQSTFLRLLAETSAGSLQKTDFEDANQVLYRLALREARNLGKRRHRLAQRELSMDPLPSFSANGTAADDLAEQKQIRHQLEALMRLLPETYRLPLQLHFFDGLSQTEIAEILEVNDGTISRRIAKGLKKLEPLVHRAGLRDSLTALTAMALTGSLLQPPAAFSAGVIFAHVQAALVTGVVASGGVASVSIATKTAIALKQTLWAAVKAKPAATITSAAFIIGAGTILTLGAIHKLSPSKLAASVAQSERASQHATTDPMMLAQASTPPTAIPSAKTSPAAKALADQMLRAYRDVQTYVINASLSALDKQTGKPLPGQSNFQHYRFAFDRPAGSFRFDYTYPRKDGPAIVMIATNGKLLWSRDTRPAMRQGVIVRPANTIMQTTVSQPLDHSALLKTVPSMTDSFFPVLACLLGEETLPALERPMSLPAGQLKMDALVPRSNDSLNRPGLKITGWPAEPGRKTVHAVTWWLDPQTHLVTSVTLDLLSRENNEGPLVEIEGSLKVETVSINQPIDPHLFTIDTTGLNVVGTYNELAGVALRPR